MHFSEMRLNLESSRHKTDGKTGRHSYAQDMLELGSRFMGNSEDDKLEKALHV